MVDEIGLIASLLAINHQPSTLNDSKIECPRMFLAEICNVAARIP